MGTFLARYVMTRLVDDIDGSDAVETLSFSLDGAGYEIDLSEAHLDAFRAALAPFVSAARLVDGSRPAGRPPARPAVRRTGDRPDAAPAPEAELDPQPDPGPDAEPEPEPRPAAVDPRDVIPHEPAPARPAALDVAPFRAPAGGREAARPARTAPAPLVADPFNPRP